jgi:uncharacterized protein YecE (DUF72 family)
MDPVPGPAPLGVGCAMWAHRAWPGLHLPDVERAEDQLAAYASVFNAVEGNTTFYGLPTPRTVARWAADTPTSFRFVFKLPRAITHERRLRDAGDELRDACDRLAPLGPRLGPTSIQLPGSFGPADLSVLAGFVGRLPRDRPWAVEVRHPAFFDGGPGERALNDLLFEHDLDRVVLDSRALFAGPALTPDEIGAHRHKPRLPVRAVALGRHPVVRFIGQSDEDANAARWTRWLTTVGRWLADGRTPLVFLHTPDNVHAPRLALRFWAELSAAVGGLGSRPPAAPWRPPGEQASLW